MWALSDQNRTKMCPNFCSHFGQIMLTFRQVPTICPKFRAHLSNLDTFWTHFGHILGLDMFWTHFWTHFGNFIKNCDQNVPIPTFSRSAPAAMAAEEHYLSDHQWVEFYDSASNTFTVALFSPVRHFILHDVWQPVNLKHFPNCQHEVNQ